MRRRVILGLAMAVVVAGASASCREKEEGPMEKAGRQLDEAVDDVAEKARKLSGEGTMERIGRHMDEAAEETKEAVQEAVDALEELGK